MTKEIEAAMQSEIDSITWMSPATKKQALIKLHGIANKIGYPDKWRDYSAVEIRPDDYLGNVDRASAFESHRQLDKIGKPVDHTEWNISPPTVNAYYDPQMNDINFPAGVLQPPLFDPKMDDAPNYGNTGGTIGHELTHVALTMRAASLTPKVICTTGGRRPMPPNSRSGSIVFPRNTRTSLWSTTSGSTAS